MVKIKTTTSLYHSELGNVNVGQIVSIDETVAEMLVKNNMAVITEKVSKETVEPTKKKSTKKGE